ncbi:hypothetical protein QAD02_014961 [Eretmocerus hayati]|uniref:Uncharacterized protein n=1 Tax=Eretmocerus hayati TaxID=131215 RepID=A0ACC2P9A0_9HYME|nr:hypothetical protein QAD02_014961 [Eretmocerus hayati]
MCGQPNRSREQACPKKEKKLIHHSSSITKPLNCSMTFADARVCVRCQTQALRRVLDWRCEGDGGTEAMITRWSMLSSPHCHGKWLRTMKTGPECDAILCQPRPNYIFV